MWRRCIRPNVPAALSLISVLVVPPLAGHAEAPDSVRWLRDYVQIDTTNPPGNERPAAEYLAAILAAEGIKARLYDSPTGRTSLHARLTSPTSRGRAVALLHHIDVVPAGEGWQEDPFSGRPLHGAVWGRGALDAKSLGIAQLAAMVGLHRDGIPLDRDVIYLAVADEERGGAEGIAWLLDAHPELFEGLEAVINEGGSNRSLHGRVIWWGIEVAQKRPLWLRVTAEGRGGHGSSFNPSSATHQLVLGLAHLVQRPPRFRVSEAARVFFTSLAEAEQAGPEHLAYRLDEIVLEDGPTEPLPPGMPGYFVDSLQITQIDNGRGANVISPTASAAIDIRLLPDTDTDAFLAEVKEALGPELGVEVVLTAPVAPASPTDHPLFEAFQNALATRAPVVPLFISGTTDSRYFRQRGIPAYGFSPFVLEPAELRGIHAVDERISQAAFLRGVETLRRVLVAFAGPNP